MSAASNDDYRFSSHGMDVLDPLGSGRIQTYKGAYVSLTSQCNTDACTYCYARGQKTQNHTMSLDLFREILDMLQAISDFPEVYLVGGEPTIVRHLGDYLNEIERRRWTTTIYTNGGFRVSQRETLRDSRAVARVAFHYDEFLFESFRWLRPRWESNLEALAGSCDVSIVGVIDGPDFPFLELVDLAASYSAAFTWIFATPTCGGTPYLGLSAMRALGPHVQEMLLYALSRGVRCAPDLPVPLCIFEPGFLAKHAEQFALIRRCQPFAYFSVDGQVSYCTAMPIFTAPRPSTGAELLGIIRRHRAEDRLLKQRPSFPECVDCEHHLRATCQGGCMTYKTYADAESGSLDARRGLIRLAHITNTKENSRP